MRRLTLLLLLLILTACGGSAPQAGGADAGAGDPVIAAFKAAGLEATNERVLEKTEADYGPKAPLVCPGFKFEIPSITEKDKIGRVFKCETREALTTLKTYYNVRGQGNPELRSFTYSKDMILVQIPGSLGSEKAKKYEAVIP